MIAIRKILIVSLAAAFFIAVGLTIYYDWYYAKTLPQTPNPDIGRVYPITIHHGIVVYLNREELSWWSDLWTCTGIGFFGVGIAAYLNIKYKVFSPPL